MKNIFTNDTLEFEDRRDQLIYEEGMKDGRRKEQLTTAVGSILLYGAITIGLSVAAIFTRKTRDTVGSAEEYIDFIESIEDEELEEVEE